MDVLQRFYLTPYQTEEFYSEFFQRMDEAKKALAIKMDLEYLLEYLKPETSIEEMKEKLEKYQSR